MKKRQATAGSFKKGVPPPKRVGPFVSLFKKLLGQAKARKVPCPLTFEEFLSFTWNTECHYCGELLIWDRFNRSGRTNLDRKVNSLGYSKANCVACCPECNWVKGARYSHEEMLLLGQTVRAIKAARARVQAVSSLPRGVLLPTG